MELKARYLTISTLLITVSFAAFNAPVQAQDTGEPAATEDPCLAILDAAWESLDEAAPDVFEDPAFMACLDALDTVGQDPGEDPELASAIESLATQEAVAPNTTDNPSPHTQDTPAPPEAETGIPRIFIYVTNSGSFMVRYWVSWFDGATGGLVAIGSGEFPSHTSRVIWVPSNATNVSIRIEAQFFINQWDSPPGCSWVLGDASLVTAGGTFHPGWPSLWVVNGTLPDVVCGPGGSRL